MDTHASAEAHHVHGKSGHVTELERLLQYGVPGKHVIVTVTLHCHIRANSRNDYLDIGYKLQGRLES